MIPQFFRDRPLTTLLLAATICVDLVVWKLALNYRSEVIDSLGVALYLSQLGLLALWQVLGQTKWLFRLAFLCAFVALIFTFDADFQDTMFYFVILSLYAALVSGITFLMKALRTTIQKIEGNRSTETRIWKFSVKHLLTWTTVVALFASVIGKYTTRNEFENLSLSDYLLLIATVGVLLSIPVTALILLKGQSKVWYRFAMLLVAAGIVGFSFAFGLSKIQNMSMSGSWVIWMPLLLQAFITGIWIITVDYDIAQLKDKPE